MSDQPRGYGRSARDRLAYNKHYYAGGVVLRNLPDLRTSEELDRFERFAVANASLSRAPMQAFTSEEFKAIHRHLFADVYAWAGQVRDYTTGRGEAPFCLPEYIDANLDRIFAEIRAADGFRDITREEFAGRAAAAINEINAVHPFIEGNGRVSREFLKDLAEHAGHRLDLALLVRETWYPAAAEGFARANNAPMRDCVLAALREP